MRMTRRILAGLLALLFLSGAAAMADANPYQSVLDMTLAGMTAAEDPVEEDEMKGFNRVVRMLYLPEGKSSLDAVGYAFVDLDGDGVEELIIGETAEDEYMDGCVLDIWTRMEGVPVLVCRGWDRYRFYLVPDAESGKLTIFTEGANSAFESQFEYGLFENGAFSVKHLLEFNSENASPWTLDGQPCEAAAAEALLAGWQSAKLDPMLMPFSSLVTEKDE